MAQRLPTYQCIPNEISPYVYSPVGHKRSPLKFLINTGAQISLITLTEAEKLNLSFKKKKIHLTGFNGNSTIAYIAKVCLWLPGEKRMISHMFAIADHEENILGYYILQGKNWQLPNGTVWSFGSAATSHSNLLGKNKKINLLRMSPILPASAVTNVKQYPIPPAAKQGINEVIKNLEQRHIIFRTHCIQLPCLVGEKKQMGAGAGQLIIGDNANTGPLTAAVPNIANLTSSLQASAHKWMTVLDVKDMFFMVSIREEDKPKFAFTWEGTQHIQPPTPGV